MASPGQAHLDTRAAAAQRSVTLLFGGRLLGMPGTQLARVAYPRPAGLRSPSRWLRGPSRWLPSPWHYWWQAHYLDAVVDSGLRALRNGDGAGARRQARLADRLLRTVRLRNLGRFPNAFYDDMAWLALASSRLAGLHTALHTALHSALHTALHSALGGSRPPRALHTADRSLTAQLRSAVTDDLGGGAFWSRHRDVKNVAASGPVALHLARTGDTATARALVEWVYARLRDDATGLLLDGIRLERGEERVVRDVFTYNQGTVLGTLLTLADPVSLARAADLVAAVDAGLTRPAHGPANPDPRGAANPDPHTAPDASTDGVRVLVTHGGGDGGLFTGILVRYLALAAATPSLDAAAARTARRLVTDTAAGFWRGRAQVDGSVFVFPSAADGRADPTAPVELATQVQAWTALEAAASIATLSRSTHPYSAPSMGSDGIRWGSDGDPMGSRWDPTEPCGIRPRRVYLHRGRGPADKGRGVADDRPDRGRSGRRGT